MRVRHKPPSFVSMWMLDVFCCALGCVTLLFLLNSRVASDEAKANQTALLHLDAARQQLRDALAELDDTRRKLQSETEGREKLAAAFTELEGVRLRLDAEAGDLAAKLATTRAEADDLARNLALARTDAKNAKDLVAATQTALTAAEAKLDSTAKDLTLARTRAADADNELRKKQKDADALVKKLADAAAAHDDLARLLRKTDDERAALVKQAADARKMLDDADGRLALTRKELDALAAAAKLAAAKAAEDVASARAKGAEDLAAARAQVAELLKKVAEANANLVDLQGDKAKLADKYDKLQKDTEARFAGIVMTGRRVVFLVDISGSMAKKDTDTADPTKWPIVVETVGKVMRSLPNLEKYQVVVFSSSARFLLGNGEWQDYGGAKSVEDVTKALLAVKPYDDTNLYAGLEKAFSLRDPGGLDAVYLFSDGLPTSGPGLTPAQQLQQPPLKEFERSQILGRHIHRTLSDGWNRPLTGKPRVKIHAVGFFFESPDVGAFLWALARDNDGSFVGMSRP